MSQPQGICTLNSVLAGTLRALRLQKGLSQESLALASGLDRSHISMLEREQRSATISTLQKILPHLTDNVVVFFDRLNAEILSQCTAHAATGSCALLSKGQVCSSMEGDGALALLSHICQLSQILDAVDSPVIVIEGNGCIAYCNKAFTQFFGLTQEHVFAKFIWQLPLVSNEGQNLKTLINQYSLSKKFPENFEMKCFGREKEEQNPLTIRWHITELSNSRFAQNFFLATAKKI